LTTTNGASNRGKNAFRCRQFSYTRRGVAIGSLRNWPPPRHEPDMPGAAEHGRQWRAPCLRFSVVPRDGWRGLQAATIELMIYCLLDI
jgi:hypothetical protein